jgi:hypothetical protein
LEGPAAKLHRAAAHADREDDPAPGIRYSRSEQKSTCILPGD